MSVIWKKKSSKSPALLGLIILIQSHLFNHGLFRNNMHIKFLKDWRFHNYSFHNWQKLHQYISMRKHWRWKWRIWSLGKSYSPPIMLLSNKILSGIFFDCLLEKLPKMLTSDLISLLNVSYNLSDLLI